MEKHLVQLFQELQVGVKQLSQLNTYGKTGERLKSAVILCFSSALQDNMTAFKKTKRIKEMDWFVQYNFSKAAVEPIPLISVIWHRPIWFFRGIFLDTWFLVLLCAFLVFRFLRFFIFVGCPSRPSASSTTGSWGVSGSRWWGNWSRSCLSRLCRYSLQLGVQFRSLLQEFLSDTLVLLYQWLILPVVEENYWYCRK